MDTIRNINRCAKRDSLNAELETMPKDFNQLKENIKIKLDLKDGMNLKEEIK